MAEESNSLQFTPTWIVALVCFIIVLMSLLAERALHSLGKLLIKKKQEALFEALQKVKEELMLLGFISLLLTVTQTTISKICIPPNLALHMLPCKRATESSSHEKDFLQAVNRRRHLLSESNNEAHCELEGKIQLISLEALHQLHIFIFVLAVVQVIFCATTMVLGGARIRQWKAWEDSIKHETKSEGEAKPDHEDHHHLFFEKHARGYWRKAAVVSWMISFFKHFTGSITKSDYVALRYGFIQTHCPHIPRFDFHSYILRTLETDFKRICGISWYLWLFVVIFLLLNVQGWHTYFWLAFLPIILLLLVGAKLEHIITGLAQEADERLHDKAVEPSDKHFWFGNPVLMLHLIHFILFQNSFEIAFFFWIWFTYGFESCIMEKLGYIIPRLIMGVLVQVMCSYSTLPLYALVSQMGSNFKKSIFHDHVASMISRWARRPNEEGSTHADKFITQSSNSQEMVVIDPNTAAISMAPDAHF
ncbi:Seven transmembrane MLO family protein [Euphorbia peplus]|nr:Seven transmembrane MLO family protein [Euphorbia peplus]